MAEVAGLVIGSVALVSLFDTSMNAFDYVETGKKYGEQYQQDELQVRCVQLRLSRWKKAVDIREDVTGLENKVVASAEETETAKNLLGKICQDLKDWEARAAREGIKERPVADQGPDAKTFDALSEGTRKLALSRQQRSGFREKLRWVFYDKKYMGRLIEDLEGNVTKLEDLFPAVKPRLAELAKKELPEVLDAVAKQGEDKAAATKILQEACTGVDPQLQAAFQFLAASDPTYSFVNMTSNDDAVVQHGTYFANADAAAQAGQLEKHKASFFDVHAKGRSRALYGHSIGGPSVLGGDFHRDVHGEKDARGGAERGTVVRRY